MRLGVNVAFGVGALAAVWLAARHVVETGWPLRSSEPLLVAAAGVLFLAAYGLKAYGWQRLFARHERPGPVPLAVAGGAASVTGVALPGRFDDVVRITVARRAGCRSCVRTLCLTLFLLGLVDAVALAPLASGAAWAADNAGLRAALAVVAGAGVGAALLLVGIPRAARVQRLARFRIVGWLIQHAASAREAGQAALFVLASWVVRTGALVLLLAALGLGFSLPLALLFLTAAAASSALPIAPAGAATQAGAGAGILVMSGVETPEAVSFAIAAQLLVLFAGATLLAGFVMWRTGRRLPFARLRPARS
ncbi:MAG: lysylphosphatidylglycerol synthase domain-containing protein [Actinomycetota bacterium]|nr:lysylphosphatidylglycerol synthase domain-containing protein [Actinomycetota bacterium]